MGYLFTIFDRFQMFLTLEINKYLFRLSRYVAEYFILSVLVHWTTSVEKALVNSSSPGTESGEHIDDSPSSCPKDRTGMPQLDSCGAFARSLWLSGVVHLFLLSRKFSS